MKTGIGHHHGAGEIIGERHPQQPPRDIVGAARAGAEIGVDQRAMLADRELVGRLKRAARLIHDFGNQQLPAVKVVPTQPLAHDVDRQQADADSVPPAQPFGHHVERLRPLQREVGGEGLGERVESRESGCGSPAGSRAPARSGCRPACLSVRSGSTLAITLVSPASRAPT